MSSNIQGCFGVFENDKLKAAIVFAIPAAKWRERVLELSRLVRLPDYTGKLTQLIAFACDELRREKWDLLISYADPAQGHHGGMYQAAGWNYGGFREPCMDGIILDGQFMHGRSCHHKWKTRSPSKLTILLPDRRVEPHYDSGKHLYWRALNVAGKTKAKRFKLNKLVYPKPNAARPLDGLVPTSMSGVQPPGAAPN